MAGGTKMTLHRYGGRSLDYKEQTIVIDETITDNLIHLNTPYESGTLEVFLNGQRLDRGIGYEEIDDYTIRIIFLRDEEGNLIPLDPVDDVVYVKIWQNHYYNRGSEIISGTDITNILKQIDEIINYGGASNLEMTYEHNAKGQIIREVSAGDHAIIREFTYTSFKELETETIKFEGKVIKKTYTYDTSFKVPRLKSTSVKVL